MRVAEGTSPALPPPAPPQRLHTTVLCSNHTYYFAPLPMQGNRSTRDSVPNILRMVYNPRVATLTAGLYIFEASLGAKYRICCACSVLCGAQCEENGRTPDQSYIFWKHRNTFSKHRNVSPPRLPDVSVERLGASPGQPSAGWLGVPSAPICACVSRARMFHSQYSDTLNGRPARG